MSYYTERSYFPGREGVSIREERMTYFYERVTALREELIPRKKSYFRELLHREELLPRQRRSFYTGRKDELLS